MSKINSLVKIPDSDVTADVTEDQVRVSYYLETVGFNHGFATHYIICKCMSIASPVVQLWYLGGFVGHHFYSYGWNVLLNFLDPSDPWPNPMDVLFPKLAKCEWLKYGFSGDREIQSAQCQLPMNNINQWSFFVYWWWLIMLIVINLISFVELMATLLPFYRGYKYKGLARRVNQDLRGSKSSLKCNMSYGDYLVLKLMRLNIEDWQFREFVRQLIKTQNPLLYVKQTGKLLKKNLASIEVEIGPKPDIGFKAEILNEPGATSSDRDTPSTASSSISSPPSYDKCTNLHPSAPSLSPNGHDSDSSSDLTSVIVHQQPPVKIERNQKKGSEKPSGGATKKTSPKKTGKKDDWDQGGNPGWEEDSWD